MEAAVEIKMTATLIYRLKTYKVVLRNEPQTVTHKTYGTQTVITPNQFAVYEAALKAQYKSWQYGSSAETGCIDLGTMLYFQQVCDPNDIPLPYIDSEVVVDEQRRRSKTAADHYHYFANLITRAGLYFALLD